MDDDETPIGKHYEKPRSELTFWHIALAVVAGFFIYKVAVSFVNVSAQCLGGSTAEACQPGIFDNHPSE